MFGPPHATVRFVKEQQTAALTTSRSVVNVTYPGGSNAPRQSVNSTVVYPYDPLTTYLSKTLRLGSATQGVILF
jgi:hypothetical protein